MIVEFAKVQVDAGVDVIKAAIHAAQMRFRPILMTSLAFVLGMLPMVLASGPGSASVIVLGTGVFFGMLVVITVGIVLVPFFFVFIYKVKKVLKLERVSRSSEGENSPEKKAVPFYCGCDGCIGISLFL